MLEAIQYPAIALFYPSQFPFSTVRRKFCAIFRVFFTLPVCSFVLAFILRIMAALAILRDL